MGTETAIMRGCLNSILVPSESVNVMGLLAGDGSERPSRTFSTIRDSDEHVTVLLARGYVRQEALIA
jgi:hypothetical protein